MKMFNSFCKIFVAMCSASIATSAFARTCDVTITSLPYVIDKDNTYYCLESRKTLNYVRASDSRDSVTSTLNAYPQNTPLTVKAAIQINAHNVTLDFNNSTIRNRSAGTASQRETEAEIGVFVNGASKTRDITILGIGGIDYFTRAIEVNDSNKITVANLRIANTVLDGVKVSSSANVRIENNIITNIKNDQFPFVIQHSYGISVNGSNEVRINKNSVQNMDVPGKLPVILSMWAISASGNTKSWMKMNYIANVANDGIYAEATDSAANVWVEQNELYSTTAAPFDYCITVTGFPCGGIFTTGNGAASVLANKIRGFKPAIKSSLSSSRLCSNVIYIDHQGDNFPENSTFLSLSGNVTETGTTFIRK